MSNDSIDIEKIKKILVDEVIQDKQLTLVDVTFGPGDMGLTLAVTLSHPEGVHTGHCSKVSRRLSKILDERDLIEPSYFLEVASSGSEPERKGGKR